MATRTTLRECLKGIAGIPGEADRAKYKGGDGLSEIADAIEKIALDADLEHLTPEQNDHLGRVLSGIQSFLWEQTTRRHGLMTKNWKAGRNQPFSRKPSYGGWELVRQPWMDHLSVQTDKEGRKAFRSEPYSLDEDCIKSLAELASTGQWSINVSASFSTHFPGHTCLISIRAKEQP